LLTLCAAVVVTLELFLIGETLRRGLPHLSLRLLISAPSAAAGTHGLLPQIINTLLLTAAALAVSLPLSALCAVWLCRTKKKRLRAVLLRAVSALSGVPSAVYGLFGYLVFGGMLSMRYSLLSGAATAALLVLPPTVFLMRSSLDAVPRRLLSGTLSLGAGEGRAVCSVLLRSARDGFVSAALLAASRVAAESAALILTAGIGETMPDGHLVSHFLRSGATLTVGMYQSVLEGENDLAFSSGVVLMLLVLLLDTMAKRRTRP
jgi:phosphate transport system permease protein